MRRESGNGGQLSLPLEPGAGSRNGDCVVEDELADSEVAVHPVAYVFVLGEGILLETGPKVPEMGHVSQRPSF